VSCEEDDFGDGETQEEHAYADPDWNRYMIRIINYTVEVAGKISIINIIVEIFMPEYNGTLREGEQGYQKKLE